ncbi:MarR family winged helix-turn-helix transcriptional regulator [Campylobacter hyointestinalis]|uniref:MarR family winged helix-turn-helix transcriptional regulator n=1 Tax=Campylobacter hyointestinalis TaxID=198 RepID=UPI000CE45259|nr:MarR family winged helix-turn-helix transcriptional regulator [Campylobacter hyointestinalis]PPB56878.1 MarR family transcriptional regulator [Campylobacter hyointestinalis subsp. hyointestinalis]
MKSKKSNKMTISLASKLKDAANQFIISKLKANGLANISPSHGDILAILFDEKPHDMTEISKRICKTKPTVTVLVEKLENSGYITRVKSDEDARISFISLSQKGITLKPIFCQISKELDDIVYKDFSQIEAEILDKLLKKAIINFNDKV